MKPNTRSGTIVILAVTAVIMLALGGLSRWRSSGGAGSERPDAVHGDRALIRLSWRFRGDRIEECRNLSEAELAAQPIHMRRPEVCEGRVAPYLLTVALDGAAPESVRVTGAGARADRPIYVYREYIVRPGTHRVSVRFEAQLPARYELAEQEAVTEHGDEHEALESGGVHAEVHRIEGPAELTLERELTLEARDVALITYDQESKSLVVRGQEP